MRSSKSGSSEAGGACDRPREHRTSHRRPGRALPSIAERYPESQECFGDACSFIFSCALERHGNGFEALEREQHLDSHPKMTRDLQGEFQTWFVVAAFEITNCLIIDPDRFGQLSPGYALLRTKNRYSVVYTQANDAT